MIVTKYGQFNPYFQVDFGWLPLVILTWKVTKKKSVLWTIMFKFGKISHFGLDHVVGAKSKGKLPPICSPGESNPNMENRFITLPLTEATCLKNKVKRDFKLTDLKWPSLCFPSIPFYGHGGIPKRQFSMSRRGWFPHLSPVKRQEGKAAVSATAAPGENQNINKLL